MNTLSDKMNLGKITLHTRLHSGIYESQGGGLDRVINEWNLGPLNLLKAIKSLYDERQSNLLGYGNIGCGYSWLEINGNRFDENDLIDEIQFEEFIRLDKDFYRAPLGKMEIAKKFIAHLVA
jgi:hypothetical protein